MTSKLKEILMPLSEYVKALPQFGMNPLAQFEALREIGAVSTISTEEVISVKVFLNWAVEKLPDAFEAVENDPLPEKKYLFIEFCFDMFFNHIIFADFTLNMAKQAKNIEALRDVCKCADSLLRAKLIVAHYLHQALNGSLKWLKVDAQKTQEGSTPKSTLSGNVPPLTYSIEDGICISINEFASLFQLGTAELTARREELVKMEAIKETPDAEYVIISKTLEDDSLYKILDSCPAILFTKDRMEKWLIFCKQRFLSLILYIRFCWEAIQSGRSVIAPEEIDDGLGYFLFELSEASHGLLASYRIYLDVLAFELCQTNAGHELLAEENASEIN